jgi:hypothetical protein
LLALGATGYAGLATLRPAPTLAPAITVPRAEAVPASPVSPLPVAAPAPAPAPAPEPPAAAVIAPVATPVSVAVNMPVMPQAAALPAPVQAVLVTTCPIPLAAPAPPRPFRHVWEPRSHRWSRASILHAGARGERGRSMTHAARAEAAPVVHDRRRAVPYAARGWSDRRVD